MTTCLNANITLTFYHAKKEGQLHVSKYTSVDILYIYHSSLRTQKESEEAYTDCGTVRSIKTI